MLTSDQVIYLDGGNAPRTQLTVFKDEITRNTDIKIKIASATPSLPGSQQYGAGTPEELPKLTLWTLYETNNPDNLKS